MSHLSDFESDKKELARNNTEATFYRGDGGSFHFTNPVINISSVNNEPSTSGPPTSTTKSKTSQLDEGFVQITDDIFMNTNRPLKEKAKIYEGYQEHVTGQKLPLAIKVIAPYKKKCIREVQHLVNLASHPNVVRIIRSKEHKSHLPALYIAIELCSSKTLQDHLNGNNEKKAPFDFNKSMLHSKGLIKGMKHIHCNRIIHGDLNPKNILFALDGDQIKVSGFGISKQLRKAKFETKRTSQGTDGYRAPETYECNKSDVISMNADIFSLGVILYSIFTNGKHPFGEDPDSWNINIKKNEGRNLSGLPEEMGDKKDELHDLLEKMMEFDPKKRPTIEEISEHSFFSSSQATTAQDCIKLSDSISMFPDRRISTHGEIYEGELRNGILETRPIVLKLVANIPQSITEARILDKLNHHSHVLSLIRADTYNCGPYDQIYIASEKCHHENLREFVVNRKKQGFAFNLSRAIKICEQMVDGVKHIHRNRIIHKDLKPDNILFSLDQKSIKIAGFGISQEIDSTSTDVFEKGQFGTNGFRPPESFGRGIISQRSDIFSLGVTFYFVLSNGEHPFGKDPDDWNYHMINGKIDLSGLLVPNIKTTEHMIKSMIAHKINDRPTIWQVSEHPIWTGNKVSCDFDNELEEEEPLSDSYWDEKEEASSFDKEQKFFSAFENYFSDDESEDTSSSSTGNSSDDEEDNEIEREEPLLDSCWDEKEEASSFDEEQKFFSAFENYFSDDESEDTSSSSTGNSSDDEEDCVQLSDLIWMFSDRRISIHGEIYEGELRSGILETRPIVLKLVQNIPQSITEARILAKLNHHSHVLSLIHTGTFNFRLIDQIYMALDECHHENLREFVVNSKEQGFAFNLSQAIEIAKQLVDGVKYIHENRIIHKDLKPDNILLSLDQKLIKIADFGISQEIDSTSTEIFEKGQFGTDGFRPPESFGRGVISQKSDIFSLGVTFYFVLSNGEHPFGKDPDGWNYHMKNVEIDVSGLLVPNIKTTEHLIKSMIKQKINDRPTIWQVSEHPFWTGNEVSCDFGYHCQESSVSLIPPTLEEHNIADLYQLLEHMKNVKLRDKAAAARTRQRVKESDEDVTSCATKPDLAAKEAKVQVKLSRKKEIILKSEMAHDNEPITSHRSDTHIASDYSERRWTEYEMDLFPDDELQDEYDDSQLQQVEEANLLLDQLQDEYADSQLEQEEKNSLGDQLQDEYSDSQLEQEEEADSLLDQLQDEYADSQLEQEEEQNSLRDQLQDEYAHYQLQGEEANFALDDLQDDSADYPLQEEANSFYNDFQDDYADPPFQEEANSFYGDFQDDYADPPFQEEGANFQDDYADW